MKGVLPVFLEGLVSPSGDIKAICIVNIMKISDKAVCTFISFHEFIFGHNNFCYFCYKMN